MNNGFSSEHKAYLKKLKCKSNSVVFARIMIIALFFALWELFARLEIINPFIFSSPSRAVNMCVTLFENGLMYHIGITLFETAIGFVLGSLLGFACATVLWCFPFLREVLEPYLIVINSLPKIALGPIIIVWVGAGISSIITVTLLISIVVAIIGILNGFLEVEEQKITLLKTFGATKIQIFTNVVLPGSLVNTVSVLKLNIGMTWVGVIVGEFLNSKAGLGYLIVYGGQIFKMDIVMSSTIILCILSAVMYYGISFFEKAIIKSRSK